MRKSSILDKRELTEDELLAIEMIESLRRLQYIRRFSKDEITELRLQLSRDLYIELAVNLAVMANYNERRTMRLAHEVNRSFDIAIEPKKVHDFVNELMLENFDKLSYFELVDILDITEDELSEILGTNQSRIRTIHLPVKSN